MAAPDPSTFPELTVDLQRADSEALYCSRYPDQFHGKFTAPHPRLTGYGTYEPGASILILESYESWWEEVGYYTRRKVRRALRSGYVFEEIDRRNYLDDIYAINTSMQERQGRPMTGAYLERPKPYPPLPTFECPRHQLKTYGVLKDSTLVAYTWVYQIGEMCLFSTILGHGAHLNEGIMFLLIAESLRRLTAEAGTRYAMYNMHWSGTEGLRFFKERMGFAPYRVHWVLVNDAPVTEGTSSAPQGA